MTQKKYSIILYLKKMSLWFTLSLINLGAIIVTLEGVLQLFGGYLLWERRFNFLESIIYLAALVFVYMFSVIGTIEAIEMEDDEL